MPIDSKLAEQPDDLTAQGGEFRTMLERLVAGTQHQFASVDSGGIVQLGFLTGFIPLDLASLREITSNDIGNIAANGGLLATDSTPALERINGATDKGLRVRWAAANVDEVQFATVPMPPDLDESKNVTVHLLARMSGATDTPTINVEAWDGIGDTEMGGNTAALSATLAELTVTLAAANITGHPLGFLNINLIPAAHGTDALDLFAAWVEYTKKVA